MITTQSPSVRGEISLANDSQRHKTVLFGGGYWSPGLQVFDDTWERQLPHLTSKQPTLLPWILVYVCVAVLGLVAVGVGAAALIYIKKR